MMIRELKIFQNPRVLRELQGAYTSTFKGQGMQFHDVKPYVRGDDIRAIDWKVSARLGSTYTKRYVEERNINILFVTAQHEVMRGGLGKDSLQDLYGSIYSLLGTCALHTADKIGLVLPGATTPIEYHPPKGSHDQLHVLSKAYEHSPQIRDLDGYIQRAIAFVEGLYAETFVCFILLPLLPLKQKILGRHEWHYFYVLDPLENEYLRAHNTRVHTHSSLISLPKERACTFLQAKDVERKEHLARLKKQGVFSHAFTLDGDPIYELLKHFSHNFACMLTFFLCIQGLLLAEDTPLVHLQVGESFEIPLSVQVDPSWTFLHESLYFYQGDATQAWKSGGCVWETISQKNQGKEENTLEILLKGTAVQQGQWRFFTPTLLFATKEGVQKISGKDLNIYVENPYLKDKGARLFADPFLHMDNPYYESRRARIKKLQESPGPKLWRTLCTGASLGCLILYALQRRKKRVHNEPSLKSLSKEEIQLQKLQESARSNHKLKKELDFLKFSPKRLDYSTLSGLLSKYKI